MITPLPVTWFGRQAKGCRHAMLGAPEWMSSTISAVSSQPSPIVWHSERIGLAKSAISRIGVGGWKRFEFFSAWKTGLRTMSMPRSESFDPRAFFFGVPLCCECQIEFEMP